MLGIGLSLTGRLRSSVSIFSPVSLFSSNEPGIWLDPSDVANLAWRRNLLTFTEQFDNAAWVNAAGTVNVTANTATAPNGTMTADKLVPAATTNWMVKRQTITLTAISHVFSVWAKLSDVGVHLEFYCSAVAGDGGAVFNLSTGAVITSANCTTSVSADDGNGWRRYAIVFTPPNAASIADIRVTEASTRNTQMTGNGSKGILVWGAQLELGSVATDYQRISDVNTEVIERFPSATLYQDTAGTLPVTTPGQTVALALDKSKGLVLGSELVTNGTFDANVTGWTATAGSLAWDGVNQRAALTVTAQDQGIQQSVITTAGKFYRCTVTITNGGAGNRQFCIELSAFSQAAQITLAPGATQTLTVLLAGGGTIVRVRNSNAGPLSGEVYGYDNISVKELPGFHAMQTGVSTLRPTYGIVPLGGRRNLLTVTDDLAATQWNVASNLTRTVSGGGTSSSGSAYTRLTATAGNTDHYLQGAGFALTAGISYAISIEMQYVSHRWVGISVFDGGFKNGATFDLLNEATGTNLGSFSSRTITPLGGNRYRLSAVYTAVSTANAFFSVVMLDADKAFATTTASNLTATTVDAGRVQIETGSTATAYQRVGAPSAVSGLSFDVTEAGVQSLSYLWFDGIDDFLQTPTITPGIDKAQVFAGVRKLSDAATAHLAELGTGTQTGSFYLAAPNTVVPASYLWAPRGTSTVLASATGFAAPVTSVVTGIADISGDVSTIRVNGTQAATSSANQGTGSFGNYALYIGRQAGGLFPFNGNLFSLIVRFGTNLDAGTITSTETWVGGKTGIDLAKVFSPTIFARDETAILDRFNATIERRAV